MSVFERLLAWLDRLATAALQLSDADRRELHSIVEELLSPRYREALDEEELEFLEMLQNYGGEIREAHWGALKEIGLRVRGGPGYGDASEFSREPSPYKYLDIDDEAIDGQLENN